jgi:hypothetical protein
VSSVPIATVVPPIGRRRRTPIPVIVMPAIAAPIPRRRRRRRAVVMPGRPPILRQLDAGLFSRRRRRGRKGQTAKQHRRGSTHE